jgi:beta-phosphoglucomutase family hydrolase
MHEPSALIFDCDGTLADTMPAHYEAWVAALAPLGISFDEDRFYAWGGWTTRHVAQRLIEEAGLTFDPDELAIVKEAHFERVLHSIRAVEPVLNVAREQRGRCPMAVATSGMRRVIEPVLDIIGVRNWFQAIVTCEDVSRHKPEPDIYLEAARRLGVPPERCLVYEDTDPGLEAARRAGMARIDVRTLFTPRRVTV